jgi:cystathionine beta-lyase
MSSPFADVTLATLRTRASAKWTAYPPDVLPAWIAELDVTLAPPIRAALEAAIASSDTGYATPRLVGAPLARYLRESYAWTVDPALFVAAADVIVALTEVLRTIAAPGASIVINSPVYPPFYRVVEAVGQTVVDVPLLHDDAGWSLDFVGLERAFAAGARGYVLCSPHNPLGRVFAEDDLVRIAELAQRYGVTVIADEIHAPLTYDDTRFVPFLRASERIGYGDAVALWSASKAWNIAGLKCATIVAGSEAMRARLSRIHSEPSGLGVVAAIAAYEHGGPWLRELVAQLDRNRMLLRDLLADAAPAVRYEPPQAGYLAWLDCGGLGLDGQPVDVFLARGRVALSRGRDFGPAGEACVRLNFGTTPAILSEVVERMRRSLS